MLQASIPDLRTSVFGLFRDFNGFHLHWATVGKAYLPNSYRFLRFRPDNTEAYLDDQIATRLYSSCQRPQFPIFLRFQRFSRPQNLCTQSCIFGTKSKQKVASRKVCLAYRSCEKEKIFKIAKNDEKRGFGRMNKNNLKRLLLVETIP